MLKNYCTAHTELLVKFAEQLLKLKKERVEVASLSKTCNIRYDQISRTENGKANITLLTLFDLAEALEVHPKKLLEFRVKGGVKRGR